MMQIEGSVLFTCQKLIIRSVSLIFIGLLIIGSHTSALAQDGESISITDQFEAHAVTQKSKTKSTYKLSIIPDEAYEFVVFQVKGLVRRNLKVSIYDTADNLKATTEILQGSSMSIVDIQTYYDGTYIVKLEDGPKSQFDSFLIKRE